MKKKYYFDPVMEIIRFDSEDVITTSGGSNGYELLSDETDDGYEHGSDEED